MVIRSHHWLITLTIAALLHAFVALGFHVPKKGARDLGVGGIEINLGVAGNIDGEEKTGENLAAEAAEPAGPAPEPAQLAKVEPVEPEPVVEPPKPEPVKKALPTVKKPKPVKKKPKPKKPKPIKKKPKPKKPKPVAKPKPKPKTVVKKPTQSKPAATSNRSTQTAAIGQRTGSQTKRNGQGSGQGKGKSRSGGARSRKGDGGLGQAKQSGGSPAAKRNYYAQLAAWLNKHKRYPRRAKQRRQQGIVKVEFTIDRNGRVLRHRIVKSSGHRLLDKEVDALLKRASPLPAMPAGFQRAKLSITVPIAFALR